MGKEITRISRDLKRATSPENKVGESTSFRISNLKAKTKVDYSLGFVFPGKCHDMKRKIQDIFNEEMVKACKKSKNFNDYFKDTPVGLLFLNEKELGASISKSKL